MSHRSLVCSLVLFSRSPLRQNSLVCRIVLADTDFLPRLRFKSRLDINFPRYFTALSNWPQRSLNA